MSKIVQISFREDKILVVDVDGEPYVVLKPALESIGLDPWTQIHKLKKRSWAVTRREPATGYDGKTYLMTVCDKRTFLMLLATIDENLVSPNVRPKLIAYQSEVADVIEKYWDKYHNTKTLYILDEPTKWEKMFDDWLRQESQRLKIPYPTLIRNYAYVPFLGVEIMKSIDEKNPIVYHWPRGRRYRQHQFLTEIKGRPELRARLEAFKAISQSCKNKKELDTIMDTYNRNSPPALSS